MRTSGVTIALLLVLSNVALADTLVPCTIRDAFMEPDDARLRQAQPTSPSGHPDVYGYDLSTGNEFPLCTDGSDQYGAAVSGRYAVWHDARNLGPNPGGDYQLQNWDIYGYDLVTKQEFPICTAPYNQSEPSISGNIVVWQDYRNGEDPPSGTSTNYDIYGFDLSTHTEFPICTSTAGKACQARPRISGDIVVWYDWRNGNADIYGYNLSTVTEFPICTNSADQYWPAVDGNIVAWADQRNMALGPAMAIYGYDLSTGTEFLVTKDPTMQSSFEPAVGGNIVVWRDYRQGPGGQWRGIYGYNIDLGIEFPICTNPNAYPMRPQVSGDIVVWYDSRNCSLDIFGFDVSAIKQLAAGGLCDLESFNFTGAGEFPVCTQASDQWDPFVSGNNVVWLDARNDAGASGAVAEPPHLLLLLSGLTAVFGARRT